MTCVELIVIFFFCQSQLGGFYIWTYSYQLVRSSATQFKALAAAGLVKSPNKDIDSDPRTLLLKPHQNQDLEIQGKQKVSTRTYIKDLLHQILEELFAPPTIGAVSQKIKEEDMVSFLQSNYELVARSTALMRCVSVPFRFLVSSSEQPTG